MCFSFNEKNQQDIEVTTLDYELDKNKSFFLKIDVEGFEWHVINGGKNILSSPNVIALIIESNDCGAEFGKKFQDIHNILIGFGFTPVVYEPISRKLTRLNNYNHGCNTIYVKDIDIMASRCKLAPLRCVHTAFDRYL